MHNIWKKMWTLDFVLLQSFLVVPSFTDHRVTTYLPTYLTN